jgi:hypothetical protein
MNGPTVTIEATRQDLMNLNEKILKAEQAGTPSDVEYLATVLSDNFVFRRADRSVVDKATFLGGVAVAAQRLADRQAFDLEVTVVGKAALVTLMVVAFTNTGAQRRPRVFKNIRFFVDRGNGWLLEHWYNEALTGGS